MTPAPTPTEPGLYVVIVGGLRGSPRRASVCEVRFADFGDGSGKYLQYGVPGMGFQRAARNWVFTGQKIELEQPKQPERWRGINGEEK